MSAINLLSQEGHHAGRQSFMSAHYSAMFHSCHGNVVGGHLSSVGLKAKI